MRLAGTSVRSRLTLWHAAALGFIVFVLSVGIYFSVRSALIGQLDRQLQHDADVVSDAAANGDYELYEIEERNSVPLFQVTGKNGVVVQTQAWTKSPMRPGFNAGSSGSWSVSSSGGEAFRVRAVDIRTADGVLRVLVAESETAVQQALRSLALTLFIGFPLALALALVGGHILAGKAMSPLDDIVGKARNITADRLSERLPVVNPNDEFGKLAIVFNRTFARLEDSFERLKRFTADASHELRTPLTAIRSIGEVALQDTKPTDVAYRDVIASMLEETDRLRDLADNLLMMARADSGMAPLKRESIDVGDLVHEAVEYMRPLFEEKGQTLSTDLVNGAHIHADRTTLRQAIINLLDNATKYTPAGGCISAAVRQSNDGAITVDIEDSGPGIPENLRDRIFERFYRVDSARSGDAGAGLGLSIARWAVEVNGGRIEFQSREGGGSRFRISIAAD
jgi:heavy metal sensor kinase